MRNLDIFFKLGGILGVLLNFLPIFLGATLKDDEKGGYPRYILLLSSREFYAAVIASIVSCLPIISDYLIDSSFNAPKPGHELFSPRRETFLALVILDVFVVAYILPYEHYDLLSGIVSSRDTIFNWAFLSYLYNLEPTIWKWPTIFSVGFLFTVANVLENFYVFDTGAWAFTRWVLVLLVGVAYVQLLWMFWNWIRFVRCSKDPHLKRNIIFCNVYTCYYAVFTVVDWFPIFIPKLAVDPSWHLFVGNIYLVLYYYVAAACTIILTVLTTRIARAETAETKQMFIRYISHEMRTPLNTVVIGLKLLRKSITNGDDTNKILYCENIDEMMVSADTALCILNDMLTYDKLQTDPLRLQLQLVSPWPIISDTIASMFIQAREVDVDLSFISAEDIHETLDGYVILADARKLSQVIRNMVSNALKYSLKGHSVEVDIQPFAVEDKIHAGILDSFGRVTQNNDSPSLGNSHGHDVVAVTEFNMLRVKIIDHGIGISMENQEKIFNEVFQFNPGTISDGGGPGFGMFITKRIVDAHGWSISVYSDGEYSGTTMTLEMPIRKSLPHESVKYRVNNDTYITNNSMNNKMIPLRKASTSFSDRIKRTSYNLQNKRPSTMSLSTPIIAAPENSFGSLSGRSSLGSGRVYVFDETAIDMSIPRTISLNNSSCKRDYSESKREPGIGLINGNVISSGNGSKRLSLSSSTMTGSFRIHNKNDNSMHIISEKVLSPVSLNRLVKESHHSSSERCDKPMLRQQRSFREDLSVLIVDDSQITRKMMARMFAMRYGSCEQAEDGLEGTKKVEEALREHKVFHAILMDYQMPKMDGPTATKKIREMGYTGPIVGVTGNAFPEDIKTFLAHGVDKVFLKPLDMDEFILFMKNYGDEKVFKGVL